MPRNKQKNLARAAAHHAERMKDVELEKRVALSLSGCSARVYKAVNSLPLRTQKQASSDNICLPDVAIYSAGHRKSAETVTAR
jgi:cell division ATPase FtsA